MTTTAKQRLTITDTTAALELLGPDLLAQLHGPLNDHTTDLFDTALARHNGDPVAAWGEVLPDDVAATMRRLLNGATR